MITTPFKHTIMFDEFPAPIPRIGLKLDGDCARLRTIRLFVEQCFINNPMAGTTEHIKLTTDNSLVRIETCTIFVRL
jgi:hypothetical protein